MAATTTTTALIRSQRHIARYLSTRSLSSNVTKSSDAPPSSPFVSSTITPALISTAPWQQEIQSLWEQASGDAELRALKDQVTNASTEFDNAIRAVAQQRRLVEHCQKQHEESYQRHASLLMRREQWSPEEASMFVQMTSQEVKARQELHNARQTLHTLEEKASSLQQTYMDTLRRKYQEEQAWQDRWRVLGTFGTWSLIGLNSLVFLVSQILFYRREARRLKEIENLIQSHMVNANNKYKDAVKMTEERAILLESAKESVTVVDEGNAVDDVVEQSETVDATVAVVPTDEGNDESDDKSTLDKHPWRIRLKQVQQELGNNLHIPSAAAGAVLSATVFGLVGVLLNRR